VLSSLYFSDPRMSRLYRWSLLRDSSFEHSYQRAGSKNYSQAGWWHSTLNHQSYQMNRQSVVKHKELKFIIKISNLIYCLWLNLLRIC
jgi:hypothetical protein